MALRKLSADDVLPDHVARWLEAVDRRLSIELGREPRAFPELRGSHLRVLQIIPPDGLRITDLAGLAGMTKQSIGEFVNYLEDFGFVGTERSASDRRVRLVRRTAQGDRASELTSQAIGRVERRWSEEVGNERFNVMKQVLRDLGAQSLRYAQDADGQAGR